MPSVSSTQPLFTFSEVLTATGAENAWLRTFIQRDKAGQLGVKHRTGRLMFSLNDIMAITVLWGLNARLRVAPAAAWEVVTAVAPIMTGATSDLAEIILHIAIDPGGSAMVWTVNDNVVVTWNNNADRNQIAAYQANQGPHIVFPMTAILAPVANAVRMTANWPEEDRLQAKSGRAEA